MKDKEFVSIVPEQEAWEKHVVQSYVDYEASILFFSSVITLNIMVAGMAVLFSI